MMEHDADTRTIAETYRGQTLRRPDRCVTDMFGVFRATCRCCHGITWPEGADCGEFSGGACQACCEGRCRGRDT